MRARGARRAPPRAFERLGRGPDLLRRARRAPSTSPPASTRSSRPCLAGYTIDWRAWASIFYLRFPIGERTPFREVKRLRPVQHPGMGCGSPGGDGTAASLAVGRGRAEPRPRRGRRRRRRGDAGGGRAPRGRPVFCTLSGGWDSRLLLCLLAEQRARRPSGRDGEPGQRPPPRGGARGGGRDEPRSAALDPGGRRCGVLGRHARARAAGGLPARRASLGDAAGGRAPGTFRSGDRRPRRWTRSRRGARTTTPSR